MLLTVVFALISSFSPTLAATGDQVPQLLQLAQLLDEFKLGSDTIDEDFRQLRLSIESGDLQVAAALARKLRSQINQSQKRWLKIENTYAAAVEEGFKFRAFERHEIFATHANLQKYIAIKEGNGGNNPVDMLVRSWWALGLGSKDFQSFADLRPHSKTLPLIRPGDVLLIFLNNGGIIRGETMGWTKEDELVLREIVPKALVGWNRRGMRTLRAENLKDITSYEVFRRAKRPSLTSPVFSPIDTRGNYPRTQLFVSAFRVEIRPSNMQIIDFALRRKKKIQLEDQRQTVIDLTTMSRPTYPALIIQTCEAELTPK